MLAAALLLRRAPSAAAVTAASAARSPTPPTPTPTPTPRPGDRRAAATTTTMAAASRFPTAGPFFLDDFAARQWDDPSYAGTRVPPGSLSKAEFVRVVADLHAGTATTTTATAGGAGGAAAAAAAAAPGAAPGTPAPYPLVDGYAPFCKHLFIPNVLGALVGSLPITPANAKLLRSGYTRRRPEELPVLTRWLRESDVSPLPAARFLDVILYSRAQLLKEYADMPEAKGGGGDGGQGDGGEEGGGGMTGLEALESLPEECVWGIISVKAQDEGDETPMQPITMLRNALGREEGGSGVALDRAQYEASAAYWDAHAAVVATDAPSGE
jgi:hypothetical protein